MDLDNTQFCPDGKLHKMEAYSIWKNYEKSFELISSIDGLKITPEGRWIDGEKCLNCDYNIGKHGFKGCQNSKDRKHRLEEGIAMNGSIAIKYSRCLNCMDTYSVPA